MAPRLPLGTRIRRARERKRWTQQQLADALDVDRKTVNNWEAGRTSPASSIGALEALLGISLDDPEPRSAVPPDVTAWIRHRFRGDPDFREMALAALEELFTDETGNPAARRDAAGGLSHSARRAG